MYKILHSYRSFVVLRIFIIIKLTENKYLVKYSLIFTLNRSYYQEQGSPENQRQLIKKPTITLSH